MKIQRNPRSPFIKSVRSMTKADIESLRQPSARVRIQNLKDSHHIMARLIVSGLSVAEIAAETGYTIARVSYLRNSPAMQELIARYRADDHDEWRKARDATYEYIHAAGVKAWRQINDTLDEADAKDELLPVRDLLKIADSSSDRVGYHRKSAKENINIDFAARLEAAFTRSRESAAKLIDAEPS